MKVCGIDVGYGNTKICSQPVNDDPLVCRHFPSIASINTRLNRGADIMMKRELIEVESDGQAFLVGPDIMDTLSARDDKGRKLLTDYSKTPQHLALLRGALALIDSNQIDILVTGLPVNNFAEYHDDFLKRLIGDHHYPNGRTITVKDAMIIPQPIGGFIHYFTSLPPDELKSFNEYRSLTIDVGSGTVDWTVCRGLKLQDERSGSTTGGVGMLLEKLARLISEDLHTSITDLNLIDRGLINDCKVRVNGKPYDFKHLMPIAQTHVKQIMQVIASSVGDLEDIDVILMVGGGAAYYCDIASEVLNNREITVLDHSIYANVKGFFNIGAKRVSQLGE